MQSLVDTDLELASISRTQTDNHKTEQGRTKYRHTRHGSCILGTSEQALRVYQFLAQVKAQPTCLRQLNSSLFPNEQYSRQSWLFMELWVSQHCLVWHVEPIDSSRTDLSDLNGVGQDSTIWMTGTILPLTMRSSKMSSSSGKCLWS